MQGWVGEVQTQEAHSCHPVCCAATTHPAQLSRYTCPLQVYAWRRPRPGTRGVFAAWDQWSPVTRNTERFPLRYTMQFLCMVSAGGLPLARPSSQHSTHCAVGGWHCVSARGHCGVAATLAGVPWWPDGSSSNCAPCLQARAAAGAKKVPAVWWRQRYLRARASNHRLLCAYTPHPPCSPSPSLCHARHRVQPTLML